MALRYSGTLTIRVTYNDRGYYNASISRKGRNLWSGTVGEPRHLSHSVDSPEAYDETAHAALSFADNEGADVSRSADHTGSGWHIARKPGGRSAQVSAGLSLRDHGGFRDIDMGSGAKRARSTKRANPARKRPAAKRVRKAPRRKARY
jgi:hypothetical protein